MTSLTCHNLCPDYTHPGTLRRADIPATAVNGAAWTPRAIVQLPDGTSRLVVTSGKRIGLSADGGIVPAPVTLDKEPTAVFAVRHDIAVMTAGGRRMFTVSGDSLVETSGSAGIPAGISIAAEAATDVVTYISELQLSKSYSGLSELTRADAARLGQHACYLYRAIDIAARSARCLFQPVVAALRFCRADGSVAFYSAPVLLTHPSQTPAGCTWNFRTLDRQTVSGGAYQAPAWRVRLTLPRLDRPDITSAQLILSPLLHAASLNESAVAVSSLGTGNDFCSATLPPGIADAYGSRVNAVATIAANISSCGSVAATITDPFSGRGSFSLPVSIPSDIDTDNATLRSLLTSAPHSVPDSALARLLPPNSFTATSFAIAGGTALWGGVSAVPFPGFAPCAAAATTDMDAWRGYVCVGFADGSSVVREVSASSGVPLSFQPLLCYPSPLATSIEIGIEAGQRRFMGRFTLTPDSSGRASCYVDPLLRPFTLPAAASYSVPAGGAGAMPLPGLIAAAPAGSPFAISCTAAAVGAPVGSILPARFSQSAWDFGRARFYLFSSAGIHSATVNAALSAISLGTVDQRPCPGGGAAVLTPYGTLAIAGTDLVSITGSRVTTLRTGVPYRSMIFDFVRHELWCLGRDSAGIDVLCPRLGWWRYTIGIDSADPARTLSSPLGSYLGAAAGILAVGTEARVGWLPVHYSVGLDPAPPGKRARTARAPTVRLRYIDIDLHGDVRAMRLSLTRAHHLRQAPAPDIAVTLDGSVTAPVRLHYVTPASVNLPAAISSRQLILTISGHAAPAMTLTAIT